MEQVRTKGNCDANGGGQKNHQGQRFTYLFRQPEYTRELYLTLHPEDDSVTEADIKLVTLENVLTVGQYNDLGIQVRDRLIVLAEVQSTFSVNIALRMLLYLAGTYKEYAEENSLNLYSVRAVRIPRPELYCIYTGKRKNIPETVRLSDLYEGQGSAEVEIQVLRSNGTGNIVDQYVRFCEISDEEREKHGNSEEAIKEILRRCREEGILAEFLAGREKEVHDIMVTLFDEEWIAKMHEKEVLEIGREQGREEGRAQGREQGVLSTIQNMVKSFGLTIEQAVAGAGIPEDEQQKYIKMLKS